MEKFNEAQLVEEPNAMPQPVEATPEEVVEAQPQAPLAEPSVAEAPVEAPVAEAPVEAPVVEAPVEDAIEEPVETAPELPNTPAEDTGNGLFKAPMEGMVPSGWVFPDELAQAVAMVTGDVEASETAPDATIAPTSPELAPQEEPQRESVEATEEPLEEKVEDLDDKLDALIAKMRKADENGNKDEVEDCKRRMIKLLGSAMKEGRLDNLIDNYATDPSEAHPEDREDLDDVLAEFGYDDEKEAIEQAHPELKEACECEGEECVEECNEACEKVEEAEEEVEEEPSEEAEEEVAEELPQEEAPVEEIGAEEIEEPIADLEIPAESEIVADGEEEVAEEEPSEEEPCDEECKEEVADAVEELKDELEDAEEPSEILDATTEFLKKIFGEIEGKEEEEVEEAPNLDVMEDPMIDPTVEEEPSEEEVAEEEPMEDIVEEPLEAVELFDGEEVGEPVEDEEEEEEEDEILESVDKFANPKFRKGEKEEEACEKCEESCEVTSDNVWEVYDKAMEYLGAEELLVSLMKALSTDELEDLFRYIARIYEIEEKVPLRAGKDAYIDWADMVVEVYLGGEYSEFSEWLAKAMGAWKLADNLEYICRCWDVPCDEEEEEEYEEACKMREEIFVPAGSKLSDDKEEKKAKVAQMSEKADARREARKEATKEADKNKFKEALNTPVSKMEEEEIPEDSWEARRIEESKGGRFSWSEFKKIR